GAAQEQIAKESVRNHENAARMVALEAAHKALEMGLGKAKSGKLGAEGARIAIRALELEGVASGVSGPPGHPSGGGELPAIEGGAGQAAHVTDPGSRRRIVR